MPYGCVAPFLYGDNSLANCPCWGCKCCPPPCCYNIVYTFNCGSDSGPFLPSGCLNEDVAPFAEQEEPDFRKMLPRIARIPSFDSNDVADTVWVFGATGPGCSIPCTSVTVTLFCAAIDGCCCIEWNHGTPRSVGDGYISGTISPSSATGCGTFSLLINGQVPPVLVSDGDLITVTLTSGNTSCCPCTQASLTNPCGLTMASMSRLMMADNKKIILNRRAIAREVLKGRAGKVRVIRPTT